MNRILSGIAVVLMLAAWGCAQATSYYVDMSWTGSAIGASNAPFISITAAIAATTRLTVRVEEGRIGHAAVAARTSGSALPGV